MANTALTNPRTNRSSTVSLNAGSIPAWWAATPRSSASRHSQKPSTPRSPSGRSVVRVSTTRRICSDSSGVVKRSPLRMHWFTAASQPARLKMKVIAGSKPSRSNRATTSTRAGGRNRGPPCRGRSHPLRRSTSWTRRTSCGSTVSRPSVVLSANRSNIREPTIMCCHSGTGRCSSTTTAVSPRTSTSHSPNSSALLTVADRPTNRTLSGRFRITSSHTAPRNRSAR